MNGLLKSRKFLLLCLDTVASLVLLTVGLFYSQYLETIKQYVILIQPVFVAIIVAISVEDAALKHATGAPYRKP